MEPIISAFEWAFTSNKNDPKHLKIAHPLFSATLGTLVFAIGFFKLTNYFESRYSYLKGQLPPWAKKYLGPFLISYILSLIVSRFVEKGK